MSSETPTMKLVNPVSNKNTDSLPVADVAVIIGYKTKDGKREEIMHVIDGGDVQIATGSHTVEEKFTKAKDPDTGQFIGHEPTGECLLTLKVKYFKAT